MSGQWRFCVTASLLLAGLSTSPAFSNPLTDLFDTAPKEAAAPAPAPVQPQCASQPGTATPGHHWVYHIEGRRKCWFQTDEATVSAKRQIHHHSPKPIATASEENEAELHKKAVLDARAQMLSAAAARTPQAAAAAPEVVDAAPAPAGDAPRSELAAPVATQPTLDAPALDKAPSRSVDVEMLLAASTLDKDMDTPSAPATSPDAPAVAGASGWEFTVARAGTGLIALGFAFLLGALLVNRFLDRRGTPIHRA